MQKIKILFLIAILLVGGYGFATPQISDKLLYNENICYTYAYPLEKLDSIDVLRPKLFGSKRGCAGTDCGRAYYAEWVIIDQQLYLTQILSCCYPEDGLKADLEKLFGNNCIDEKVKADWFTGKIYAFYGNFLPNINSKWGYDESFRSKEIEFEVEKGQILRAQFHDNKTKHSEYSSDEKLFEFIRTNIRWDTLPKLDSNVRIVVQFSANANGVIDDVKIIKGYNEIYDQEVIRVIKAIPIWDIDYMHGEPVRKLVRFPIIFHKTKEAVKERKKEKEEK